MTQRSDCKYLEDVDGCHSVNGCLWNTTNNTCEQTPDDDIQLLNWIRANAEHKQPDIPYPYLTYNRFVRQDSGACESCVDDTLRSMSELPVDRQAFMAYFLGRVMFSAVHEDPPLPTASLDTWQEVTETVDRIFPPSTTSRRQKISMPFFMTMLKFLTYGLLASTAAAGTRKMTYCFSANDIAYSTEFASLSSDHPEICATFDNAYGAWLWHHSAETTTIHRKGGSVVRPKLLASEIEHLQPIVTCYDADNLQIEPTRSEWCSAYLVGNSFTSADTVNTGMYVVMGVLCCLVFGFKIHTDLAKLDGEKQQRRLTRRRQESARCHQEELRLIGTLGRGR
jgi:hypothetical protein